MDVSVVIPTYNRRRPLLRCVSNVPRDIKVVVVDDGSNNGTAEAISRVDYPNLTYARQSNSGPAAARNTGVRLSSGRYIVFTDDDCVPVSPWPWPLIDRLEMEPDSVAGVGGRVLPFKNGLFARYYSFHKTLEPPESCSYLVTANCAYRKEIVESVGGFDSRVKQPGGEDPGLSMKVRA